MPIEKEIGGVAYLSIALPALAGALRGIGAQREHLRNVRRSGQMARYLAIIRKRMDRASNLTGVHAPARQAEAVMLEENSDWFLTMSSCIMPSDLPRAMRGHHATRAAGRMSDATTAVARRQGAGRYPRDNGEGSPP